MLVLRLLVMVLTIICLMDGHAEVSSSTTGIRDRRESPAVNTNDSEVDVLDRKKKKKPKPSKKKKPKPGKKKPKPNKAKPKPTKPVTTTTTMSTSTLKTTTILTTPTITTTATTTTTTVSPTTTETTVKTTTSTASATTTLSTTTSATTTTATTTTVATSSTASTTTTTIKTTATTSSLPTTAATTADSGAGGECKATNGKPCIFPFKDGNEEYNECKNEGGKYFWCATSVYDSGKYKHWSYCPEDRSCPLEGDGECRATNNKPCVFPFKDGNKEYNECADHSGQYFWCATGTNSAGKYSAWSKCPKDGSCPLPQKTTTPVMTPAATAATTTLLTTGTSTAPDEIENKVVNSLKDLVKEESKDGTLEMLEAMHKITETIIDDLKAQSEDNDPKNIESNHTLQGSNPQSQELSIRYKQGVKSGETREIHQNFEFVENTVYWRGSISPVSDASGCCSECQWIWSGAVFFDYIDYFEKCLCYEKLSNTEPLIRENNLYSAGVCGTTIEDKCCETLTLSASSGAAQHQGHRLGTYKKDGEHNNKAVYKQQQGTNVLHYFRESNQFRWSFASSVNSGGGLSSKLGDASVCPSDVKIWQYYWPGTNNLWLVDSTVAVDCKEDTICALTNRVAEDCPETNYKKENTDTDIPFYVIETIKLDKDENIYKCALHCESDENDDCDGFSYEICKDKGTPTCILLSKRDLKGDSQTLHTIKGVSDFCKRKEATCSLKCPSSFNNIKQGPLYMLSDEFDVEDEEECGEKCLNWEIDEIDENRMPCSYKCIAVISTECNKCQLLTHVILPKYASVKPQSDYCLYETMCGSSFLEQNRMYKVGRALLRAKGEEVGPSLFAYSRIVNHANNNPGQKIIPGKTKLDPLPVMRVAIDHSENFKRVKSAHHDAVLPEPSYEDLEDFHIPFPCKDEDDEDAAVVVYIFWIVKLDTNGEDLHPKAIELLEQLQEEKPDKTWLESILVRSSSEYLRPYYVGYTAGGQVRYKQHNFLTKNKEGEFKGRISLFRSKIPFVSTEHTLIVTYFKLNSIAKGEQHERFLLEIADLVANKKCNDELRDLTRAVLTSKHNKRKNPLVEEMKRFMKEVGMLKFADMMDDYKIVEKFMKK